MEEDGGPGTGVEEETRGGEHEEEEVEPGVGTAQKQLHVFQTLT